MADIRKKSDRAWLVRWREDGRQRYRQFLCQHRAERKAERAAKRHHDARPFFGRGRDAVAAHDGGQSGKRHHQRAATLG